MADNAAQSIKDLQQDLNALDKKIESTIGAFEKYNANIASLFEAARREGIVSTDKLVDYVVKKLSNISIKKLASPFEDMFGLTDQKAADEAVKHMEETERKRLEIEKAYNDREMQLTEEREKKKLQAEQAYAKEREKLLELERKKQEDYEKAWMQHDKQQAASKTDLNKLGDLAATRGLTGVSKEIKQAEKEANEAAKRTISAFDRVIIDINKKAEAKKGILARRIFDAEAIRDEYKKTAASLVPEITRLRKIINQSEQPAYNWAKYVDDSAIKRYKAALLEIEKIQQRINTLNDPKLSKYDAHIRAVEGVTRRYNDNEQALTKLQQHWEELNVKKQAGLINQKDFDAQTQKILDQYDRLIAKRKEFYIGDLGQMSSERIYKAEQERLEAERKNAQDRLKVQRDFERERSQLVKKTDSESLANQRRQIEIKSRMAVLDKNRAAQSSATSAKEKAQIASEIAEYKSLSQELTKLIARQKELDRIAKGSGNRARQKLETYEITQSEKALRQYEQTWLRLKNTQQQTTKGLQDMLPTLQRLASAFGIAFSVRGLAKFGKKLIETRGEFELQQVALRSILQNKQLADEIWDKTMQAALQSPFTAMQLTKYTKQLAAYRIETDKLFDTTKRLADVSAGLGVDMQRLILAYGQVKAANYLRASEIRQFTEAGVNILGELSQYFTETREGMYDTAKVMDMVTKRMVKFEDVEAIFKRMTDQGGIFYEMQYVQSQTVKGQINKLRDAYDQMQNSIGKANEGVLKDMVSLLNSIVKNWRTWAVVLKSIAWGAVIGYLSKFALPLMGIGKASVSTLRSIVRLRQGVQSLGASLKANLPMLGIFAATAVITALNNLRKKMNEVNKEIDEQNLRLYETRQNFEGMKSKIEENNRILKTAGSKTEDLNKAQKENESIMQRLRNEYPQLADQMQIATNGIIDMNDALDANIRKLNEQMTVLNAMKQGNWFSDSDQKNLADWQGALATMKTTLISAQSEARKKVMQMELGGETDEPLYDIYKRVADIDLSGNILDAVNAFNLLNGEVLAYQSNLYKGTPTRSESLYSILGIKVGKLQANWSENRVKDVLDRLAPTLQSYYENGIKDNADFLKEINEQYGGNVTQFIQANAEKINQATLDGLNNANSILINTLKPQTAEMKTFLNQELNRLFGTTGIDYFSTSTKGTTPTTADPEGDKQSKIDAAWRRRINLIEEMKKRYDELSKSAFGYAKSEKTVREAFDDSFAEIFKGTSIDISQIDFTSMSGMMESMKVLLEKAKGVSDSVREELMKKIDSFEAQITIDAQVRIREDFGKQMEKAFNDYELTLELDKLNIPPEAAKDLFPAFETQTLGQMQDIMRRFYEEMEEKGVSFDEEDLKEFQKWADKIDAEILKSRKERAKEYSKFLEREYSDRAKVEMQYAKDVAFVTANFSGQQQKNILEGINDKFQKDVSELNWKSFKESSFYVEMMDDLSSVPIEYMKIMLSKIEEILQNPEALPPRALKEAINARQKIIEAQMDFDQIAVMKESMAEIREAMQAPNEDGTGGVGGKNWRQTKKRLDEEQKAQAEKLAGIEQEIRANEKLQGQLKGLEDAQKAFNDARKALSSETISDLGELNDPQSLMNEYEADIAVWKKQLDDLKKAEGEATPEMNDQIAKLEERIRLRQIEIGVLEKYKEAMRGLGAYESTEEGQAAVQAQGAGQTSTSVGGKITQGKKDAENVSKRLSLLQKWQKAFKNFNDSFSKFNKNAADMVNRLGALSTAAFDLYEALGGETDAMTDAWKEFGGTIVNTITQALTMIPALVAGFVTAGTTINAAMGIIGLIAEAIQLVLVLITGLAKLHDAGYEAEIERQQKKIDDLQRAYDRLEKQIEKTWDTASYIRTYNEETQNLYAQIEALNKQIAAENAKKDTDADKIQGYKDSIRDAEDELEELKQKQIEVFGGIGEEGYRDAAQEFVDAWKSAFLETGDGLQGLQEHFDEFLNDWFVKQATMRVAGRMLEPLFRQIDSAVDQYSNGGANVLMQELQEVREKFGVLAPQLSEALEELAGMWGLGGEGALSGLAAGIQGMTEEQANILEAYWNSVRGYTASIDMNVARIVEMMSSGGGNVDFNPMLQQLNLIAANTQATHQLLQSVTKSGHSQGGYGIKVFAD